MPMPPRMICSLGGTAPSLPSTAPGMTCGDANDGAGLDRGFQEPPPIEVYCVSRHDWSPGDDSRRPTIVAILYHNDGPRKYSPRAARQDLWAMLRPWKTGSFRDRPSFQVLLRSCEARIAQRTCERIDPGSRCAATQDCPIQSLRAWEPRHERRTDSKRA